MGNASSSHEEKIEGTLHSLGLSHAESRTLIKTLIIPRDLSKEIASDLDVPLSRVSASMDVLSVLRALVAVECGRDTLTWEKALKCFSSLCARNFWRRESVALRNKAMEDGRLDALLEAEAFTGDVWTRHMLLLPYFFAAAMTLFGKDFIPDCSPLSSSALTELLKYELKHFEEGPAMDGSVACPVSEKELLLLLSPCPPLPLYQAHCLRRASSSAMTVSSQFSGETAEGLRAAGEMRFPTKGGCVGDVLFSSQTSGASIQALSRAVTGYNGVAAVVVTTELGVFGSVVEGAFRETTGIRSLLSSAVLRWRNDETVGKKGIEEEADEGWFGTRNGFLFTLSPSFAIYRSRGYAKHFAWLNSVDDKKTLGLGFGGQFLRLVQEKFHRIFISEDLRSVTISSFDATYEKGDLLPALQQSSGSNSGPTTVRASKIDLVGLSGRGTTRACLEWRRRQEAEIERRRKIDRRQLAGESTWREGGDKYLLDLVGITGFAAQAGADPRNEELD